MKVDFQMSIEYLGLENQPGSGSNRTGSGALGLTGDVRNQKYENKKKALKIIEYSFNRL